MRTGIINPINLTWGRGLLLPLTNYLSSVVKLFVILSASEISRGNEDEF